MAINSRYTVKIHLMTNLTWYYYFIHPKELYILFLKSQTLSNLTNIFLKYS